MPSRRTVRSRALSSAREQTRGIGSAALQVLKHCWHRTDGANGMAGAETCRADSSALGAPSTPSRAKQEPRVLGPPVLMKTRAPLTGCRDDTSKDGKKRSREQYQGPSPGWNTPKRHG